MLHDDSILRDFVTESNEHLALIETQLLEIETAGAETETVNALFRAIHSIKGAAGFLGFAKVNDLSHAIESVMDRLRTGAINISAEVVDVLLRSCDELKSMVNNLEHSNSVDVTSLVACLGAFADSPAVSMSPTAGSHDDATASLEAGSPIEPTVHPTGLVGGGSESNQAGDANVRVSVGLLDRLMNLAGELVLSRNQLLQAVGALQRPDFDTIASRLDQVTSELQEAVMQTRMQPLAGVFARFPRVVRDLSARLGKLCELTVLGKDVEVDKSILEAIGDPLLHIVRNALDHGLETPDARARLGKRHVGCLILEAAHQAGKVVIRLRDDGAGIDPAKLRVAAVSKGVVSAEQAATMSDHEAINIIFHPGFSTAERVTDVSGRGVGMDVVKANITKLGGAVEVSSELGRGTTITIELPLTLAIIPSLIVQSGGAPFALSQASIVELVRVSAADASSRISTINDSEVLKLRGKLLPLVRLSNVLAGPNRVKGVAECRTSAKGDSDIIIVDAGSVRYGLVVDGLSDSEEIVVKPLGRHLKGARCLAGATILGDGRVAFILDANGIASFVGLQRSDSHEVSHDDNSRSEDEETQLALLLANGPVERFAVPMAIIKRLERVPRDRLTEVGGRLLLEYESISLPLLVLEDLIRAEPAPEHPWSYIVVFEAGGRELGLVAPQLVEIRKLSTRVDTTTLREPGVVGSLVADHRAVRLLDVFELAIKAGLMCTHDQAVTREDLETTSILLVEDSTFFRGQVMRFLETLGHRVVPCEDGQQAWETLSAGKDVFSLVVTDIEMPRMNGYELCSRIKTDPRFDGLPVLALTSLAGEDDVTRGRQVGIDEYQVKMDRDRLLSAVERLIAKHSVGVLTNV
jgi:two-component system chemotaxis sensor kinase CheA